MAFHNVFRAFVHALSRSRDGLITAITRGTKDIRKLSWRIAAVEIRFCHAKNMLALPHGQIA
ncbi:MAG: hypothetical protein AAF217_07465 [Pseudomonadota bacterium]